jgi:hypothetical protein
MELFTVVHISDGFNKSYVFSSRELAEDRFIDILENEYVAGLTPNEIDRAVKAGSFKDEDELFELAIDETFLDE